MLFICGPGHSLADGHGRGGLVISWLQMSQIRFVTLKSTHLRFMLKNTILHRSLNPVKLTFVKDSWPTASGNPASFPKAQNGKSEVVVDIHSTISLAAQPPTQFRAKETQK